MKKIYVQPGMEIELGKRGENLARCVVFDISGWENTYGEGTVHLLHQRNGDKTPYPCVIKVSGGKVRWTLTEVDMAVAGRGKAELQYFVGEARVKSEIWATRTKQTLNNAGPVPDEPAESWLNTLLELGTVTQENAETAEEAAQEAAAIVESVKSSEENAQNSADLAAEHAENAVFAAENAEAAQQAAENARDEAEQAVGKTSGFDDRLKALEEQKADLDDRIEELEGQMADLLYTPINITSFTHNAGTREMGDTVTEVKLSWSVNKQPSALTLDGESLSTSQISQTLSSLSITKDSGKTWTLKATDERGAVSTKSTGISFQNGIYYGCAAVPETVHSAFVMGLEQKILSGNKNRTVTFSGGNSLYAWYCYPKRLGLSLFNIGGFDYDYEYITVPFTNQFGVTEDYYVYRSGQYVPTPISVTVKNGG